MTEANKDLPRTKEDLEKYNLGDDDGASAIKAAVEVQMKHPELDIWKYLAECDFNRGSGSNLDLWYEIYSTLQKNTGFNPSGGQLAYLKSYMNKVGKIGMSSLRKTPKVETSSASSASSARKPPEGGRKSVKSKHSRMKLKRTRSKKIKKCSRRSRRS